MPPLVQVEEYFADLLEIASSESLHGIRLQPVELLLGQFEITLGTLSETEGTGDARGPPAAP